MALLRFIRIGRDRRAAVALMVGVMSPALIGLCSIIVDTGFWFIGSVRLQVAADAGAMGAGLLLQNPTVQAANNQAAIFRTAATTEVNGSATKLAGTINTPTVTWDNASYTWVTVTLTSQMPSIMLGAFTNATAPLIRATATASVKAAPATPCVLTLGTSGVGIKVDNSGTVSAANCAIGSNSTASNTPDPSKASIYLNSGTITADSLSTAGKYGQSNSGSNVYTVKTTSQNATATPNPFASKTAATPSNCDVTNGNFTGYNPNPYRFTPSNGIYVFCGNTTIGGNSSTQIFDPGIYYVVNGDLTFNNASITTATDVSFVLTGSNPGNFSWTNYSNTSTQISAPSTGATAGIAIWQACKSNGSGNGQSMSFQGGSTLLVTGAVYAPCSDVDVGNAAVVKPPLGKSFTLISKTIYAHGSGEIRTVPATNSGGGTNPLVLTN